MERPIIEIDEDRCNGCGQCILDCAEGALAIVNGKAKLISDVYCDGLGACLNCPQGALSLRTREAPAFDEAAALAAKMARENKGKQLSPLMARSTVQTIVKESEAEKKLQKELKSHLKIWPLQLELMPPRADYLQGADLLFAAHCSGFALPHIAEDWLSGRIPIIACPKLEDNERLISRLAAILAENEIKSLTVLRMSVPCCGLERIVREAAGRSGKPLEWNTHVVRTK